MNRRHFLATTALLPAVALAAPEPIAPVPLADLVPYQFEWGGSLIGPPGPLHVWPITGEAERQRVWPVWQGRRWQRETATSYVIQEPGLQPGAGLTLRIRVRAKP